MEAFSRPLPVFLRDPTVTASCIWNQWNHLNISESSEIHVGGLVLMYVSGGCTNAFSWVINVEICGNWSYPCMWSREKRVKPGFLMVTVLFQILDMWCLHRHGIRPNRPEEPLFVYEGKGVPKQNPVFTPSWQTDFCAAPSPTGPFPCATIHPADA